MRHFAFLDDADRSRLFRHAPAEFGPDAPRELLACTLGATLYSPATRPTLARDLLRGRARGVVSSVLCLEDAISDAEVPAAERNLIDQLRRVASGPSGAAGGPPLVFVRVRAVEQIRLVVDGLGDAVRVLSGFVIPKFDDERGAEYLDAVADARAVTGLRMFAMPVLETAVIAHADTRLDALLGIRRLVDKYRDLVLAVRIGATDLGAAYGLRRGRDLTVYDVHLLASVIADVVNVFARQGDYVVTGPVWEYFTATERLFKPQLRESPFVEHDERRLRARLIAQDLDGLIREVALDRANGLTGKTVIHPSHVAAVHALSVVTSEEYDDACDIAGTAAGGGVRASAYGNKMNESKPHTAWALRTLRRADAFGVAREEVSFVDLLAAAVHADG
ncbi:MAG: ATP/GTP-binding protein [Jatrophihabitans sp.]|nr:MAG: ATP/GTP-binding protein [Jatrophihabitans sp.]